MVIFKSVIFSYKITEVNIQKNDRLRGTVVFDLVFVFLFFAPLMNKFCIQELSLYYAVKLLVSTIFFTCVLPVDKYLEAVDIIQELYLRVLLSRHMKQGGNSLKYSPSDHLLYLDTNQHSLYRILILCITMCLMILLGLLLYCQQW